MECGMAAAGHALLPEAVLDPVSDKPLDVLPAGADWAVNVASC